MAIIHNIINALDNTLYVNLVNSGFAYRPIGLLEKDYRFILDVLNRGIGNHTYDFDGFGSAIGDLAEPNMNERYYRPWFHLDADKSRYANYIRYVEGVRDTVVERTTMYDYRLFTPNLEVARPEIKYYIGPQLHPNDTYTGKLNDAIGRQALTISAFENTDRLEFGKAYFGGHSISDKIYSNFGWNQDTLSSGALYYQIDNTTGRVAIPTLDEDADIDYGDYRKLLTFGSSLSSISDLQKRYLFENISRDTYYPYNNNGGLEQHRTYLDQFGIGGSVTPLTAKTSSLDSKYTGRYDLAYDKSSNLHSTTLTSRKIYLEYAEAENGSTHEIRTPIGYGTASKHMSLPTLNSDTQNSHQLLHTTQQAFANGKYKTIIARFHTDLVDTDDETQTAISSKYGMSHGRNLLKVSPTNENGYENPYCRVWTYHHQYAQVKDQIRSFGQSLSDLGTSHGWDKIKSKSKDSFGGGLERLSKNGVLYYDTGYVKIAPSKEDTKIKNCMFSIENLAWKGVKDLSAEQRGPLGGRIMWFPPYDISFNENVSVEWNGTKFIGRGEQIYTYANTDRSGNLSWKILIDHPSILDYWNHKDYGISADAVSTDNNGNVDTVDNTGDPEQELLRFFAGCDVLDVGNMTNQTPSTQIVTPEPPTVDDDGEKLTFYVFYPNDYSGVDDDPYYAMAYLVNGIGTNKTLVGNDLIDLPIDVNSEYYGIGGMLGKDEAVVSFGYEMFTLSDGFQHGISLIGKSGFENVNKIRLMFESRENDNEDGTNIYTQYRHGHRVDKKNQSTQKIEKGVDVEQYLDLKSYGFNSAEGYKRAVSDLNGSDSDGDYVSFADMFYFLQPEAKAKLQELNRTNYIDEENQAKLETIFKNNNILNIDVTGFASGEKTKIENWSTHNNTLAANRAKSVANWMRGSIKNVAPNFDTTLIKSTSSGTLAKIGNNLTSGNHSEAPAKEARCAKVVITYSSAKDTNLQSTQNGDGINDLTVGDPNSSEKSQRKVTNNTRTSSAIETKTTSKEYGNHDSEYQFFQKLEANSPLMRHRISEKIKFFDPAFHAISPEGFNARLTFLHQCTRQGPTISSSDYGQGRTANNLSFGRPPICVLRIGDFYYTKIAITSLNITYDPLQWDLNDEGIGVMPMIAKVDLNFHFLGGSDLAGPIERLQNAVSFNYYANTGVYDNRSDMVQYDADGNREKFSAFVPQMDEAEYSSTEYKNTSTDEKSGVNTQATEAKAEQAATSTQAAREDDLAIGNKWADQIDAQNEKELAFATPSDEAKAEVRATNTSSTQTRKNTGKSGSGGQKKTTNTSYSAASTGAPLKNDTVMDKMNNGSYNLYKIPSQYSYQNQQNNSALWCKKSSSEKYNWARTWCLNNLKNGVRLEKQIKDKINQMNKQCSC